MAESTGQMTLSFVTGYPDNKTAADATFNFDDPVQILLMGLCFLIISLLGLVGNGLVVFAIIASRKLRSVTNVFVVNLAISDFIGCLMLPIFAATYLSSDLQSNILCALAIYVAYVMFGASAVNIMLIALNRYCLIIHSKEHGRVYSKRNVIVMVIVSWAYTIAIVCVPPIFGMGIMGYSIHYRTCGPINFADLLTRFYTVVRSILGLVPFLVVTFVCYVSVFRFVYKTTQTQRNYRVASGQDTDELTKRQITVTKKLFLVVCAYIGFTTPYVVAYVIPALHAFRSWAAVCLAFNSCVNPFIYGFWHPHFNEVFKCIISCNFSRIPQPTELIRKTFSSQTQSTAPKLASDEGFIDTSVSTNI